MSAATATADVIPTPPPTYRRPGFRRLTQVELRKMLDTRAGFWLQMTVLAASIAVVVIVGIVGHADDHQFMDLLWSATAPAMVLLPIVGILLVSSEWSQRTAVVTFTLVPQRMRVMVAKLGAAVVAALVAFAVAFVIGAVATVITASDAGNVWSMPIGLLGQTVLAVSLLMVMGVAFGAVFLNSAPAIVVYFVLPTVWSALGSIHAIEGAAKWLDVNRAANPLTDHMMSATEWARLGTSVVLWIGVPLAVGLYRIARSELR